MAKIYTQDPLPYGNQVIALDKRVSEEYKRYFLSQGVRAWGQAELTAGQVTIEWRDIQSSDLIASFRGSAGTGVLSADSADIVPGESFTIKSSDLADTGTVNFIILTQ